ncbi:ROK family transcriptional regulator [Paenibacillus hamazuiensis]|uniref:ROK family transcriptional regulator n=1 Tax=Paenibacillus hamazuiensis TaxID=2936508 RepID=UPI00200D183C|nr:ROK family transcriptional regulator [Paenibacillus hamazuiensis]
MRAITFNQAARTGNLQLMKEINQSLIFNAIREKGPLSRSQLAKDLSLSPTTVTVIVDRLMAGGFLMEVGKGDSSGGRKPVLVQLKPGAGMVIAIDLDQETAAILNMNAEILLTRDIPPFGPDNLVEVLIRLIREMVREFRQMDALRLIGIGIAVPGIIDLDKGKVITAANMKIYHLSLKEELAKHFQVPILLENDANAAAYGEFLYGRSRGVPNFLYLHVGKAVGAGLFLSGSLFTGGGGGAGEFGHVTVDHAGPVCHCGNIGCLGDMISAPILMDKWREWTGGGEPPALPELVALSNRGDSTAVRIMEYAGELLGRGIITLVHLFNPSLIIMGGELALDNSVLMSKVNRLVQSRTMPMFSEHVQILESVTRLHAGIVGAGSLALNHFFNNIQFESIEWEDAHV